MKKSAITLLAFCLFASPWANHVAYSQWTQLPNLPVTGTVYDMWFINQTTGWMTLQSPTSIISHRGAGNVSRRIHEVNN